MPDWRDAAAYAPLLDADRSLFAWEWLRRNRSYRAAAGRASRADTSRNPTDSVEAPERWGLHAFEQPHLTAPDARPVWCADIYPHVLAVNAMPAHGEDVFDLDRFRAICTLVNAADGCEHLLVSDGLRAIRIDVQVGSLKHGPVQLEYLLAGFAIAEKPLLTLRRLLAFWRTGRFSAVIHPREARARRFVLMLRAYDALACGATQRDIAAELLSSEAEEDRWRVRAPTLRSQAQRLVRGARSMASGGYASLLAV